MGFVQIVEYTTSRTDEIEKLINDWRAATEGKRKTARALVCKDRDRANHYYTIVEFSSYEDAMKNSSLPETAQMAEQMAKLCDGPPTFLNLDLERAEQG
jgi:hypothetical protein